MTQVYANQIGADGFSSDASRAVSVAKSLMVSLRNQTRSFPYLTFPPNRNTYSSSVCRLLARPELTRVAPATRPHKTPAELVYLLGEVGAYGNNFHENDLIAIDAATTEADVIKKHAAKPWPIMDYN